MRKSEVTIWTDDLDRWLCDLWREGLTTTEIGLRMGRSKNSVVGRVHRIARRYGLEPRANPIGMTAAQQKQTRKPRPVGSSNAAMIARSRPRAEAKQRRAGGLALDAAASAHPPSVAPQPAPEPSAISSLVTAGGANSPEVAARLTNPLQPRVSLDDRGCQYPLWADKARPDHRYCGKDRHVSPEGKRSSWCAHHFATVFVPPKKKGEEGQEAAA